MGKMEAPNRWGLGLKYGCGYGVVRLNQGLSIDGGREVGGEAQGGGDFGGERKKLGL
jgi:hypothetical protein